MSAKFYYTLNLSYDGSHYFGWQRQKGLPTIQQTILDLLQQEFPLETFNLIGASRTDARVHALDQYAQLITSKKFSTTELLTALKQLLPQDISIMQVHKSHARFMVIYSVKSKSYFYLFSTGTPQRLFHPHVTHFTEELDITLMRQTAQYFIGTHSFHNFQYKMNPRNTTIRTIIDCKIIANPPYAPIEGCYALEIKATGFLKQMVRIIMGTLVNTGQYREQAKDIYAAFHPECTRKLGFIAPANGLHLQKIDYH